MTTVSLVRALTFMIMIITIAVVMVLFFDTEREDAIAIAYNQLVGALLWALWSREFKRTDPEKEEID